MTINEILSQALLLTAEERELLAVDLLGSLTTPETQAEIDTEWDKEIEARSDACRTGTAVTFDAQESLDRIRARLAARTKS